MARLSRLCSAHHGQRDPWHAHMDHHIHHHYFAYGLVRVILDQLDVYNELYHAVRIAEKVGLARKQS